MSHGEHDKEQGREGGFASFQTSDITFLAEKNGNSETELKARLVEVFKANTNVSKAYLALVQYGNSSETKVALCLKADGASRDQIVKKVGSIFSHMFRTTDSLDILFLSPKQENAIAAIARPFYEQG